MPGGRVAGPGTRRTSTVHAHHGEQHREVGGARRGKAIIILNPAEPPLIMRDTVHCLTEEAPDEARIRASIEAMIAEVQKYVPGYTLKNGPVFDGKRVSTYLEVAGLGDYLPKYAGNLDIMTAAALRTTKLIKEKICGRAFVTAERTS
jgi:acetaldehyde/propanal dehydrogenase